MKSLEKPGRFLRTPKLTRTRMMLALAAAVVADGAQLLLGPLGWAFGDQLIDVAAMLLVSGLIGFHWLLLPSFVLELVPVADEFPTWTACVVAVMALRRHRDNTPPAQP
jgi:hypothetical protein